MKEETYGKAKPILGTITVKYEGESDGRHHISMEGGTGTESYEAFLAAPAALEYGGRV